MFNQIELFFVNPAIMAVSHSVLMGHFTSNHDMKHEGSFDLCLKTDGEKVKSILAMSDVVYENLVFSDYANSKLKQELHFINSPSLNALMTSKQLKTYSNLMNENDLFMQVCFIQVPSLNEGEYSYLFFGFVKSKIAEKIHSKLFYTDRNGVVHEGGEVKHKMGNNISNHFCNNFAFGFGENLALSCTSPKDYLEGLNRYKKIKLSSEEIDKETEKDLEMVFHPHDEEYFKFISAFSRLMKEKGQSENMNFWMTKDYHQIKEEVGKKAIKEAMSH